MGMPQSVVMADKWLRERRFILGIHQVTVDLACALCRSRISAEATENENKLIKMIKQHCIGRECDSSRIMFCVADSDT